MNYAKMNLIVLYKYCVYAYIQYFAMYSRRRVGVLKQVQADAIIIVNQ